MWDATPDERLAWMDQLTSAETAKAMPHYIGATWFNVSDSQRDVLKTLLKTVLHPAVQQGAILRSLGC